MAKVTNPIGSQEARGQVGGNLVFTQRRGQSVVRGFAAPTNPNTENQQEARVALAVTGIITRQVNSGNWRTIDITETWIEFLQREPQPQEVWSARLSRLAIGKNREMYTRLLEEYNELAEFLRSAWESETQFEPINIPDYTNGKTRIRKGMIYYIAQRTMQLAGYGPQRRLDAPLIIRRG